MLPLLLFLSLPVLWAALVDFLAEHNAKEQESLTIKFLYYAEKKRKERKQVESLIRKQSHKTQP